MFKKENYSFLGGKDMEIFPSANTPGEVFVKKFITIGLQKCSWNRAKLQRKVVAQKNNP